MSVESLADGQYEMNIFYSGDLFEDAWTRPALDSPVKFSMPFSIVQSEKSKLDEFRLNGEKSLVGLGVTVKKQGDSDAALLGRGVVGVNSANAMTMRPNVFMASCKLVAVPNSGLNITGRVEIKRISAATRIRAQIKGLPSGNLAYGFHIHEYGDLGSADGMSTKGHYNPLNAIHRIPGGRAQRPGGEKGELSPVFGHVGDLGNIQYFENNGDAWYDEINMSAVELNAPLVNVLGRAIVVHSQMDNGCEQPTGGAGKRLAVCVIGAMELPRAFFADPPFAIPAQQGSPGCDLDATPVATPMSKSFIWAIVVIGIALLGIGGMLAYNTYFARNNNAGASQTSANGRQPWYAHQNEGTEDEESTS